MKRVQVCIALLCVLFCVGCTKPIYVSEEELIKDVSGTYGMIMEGDGFGAYMVIQENGNMITYSLESVSISLGEYFMGDVDLTNIISKEAYFAPDGPFFNYCENNYELFPLEIVEGNAKKNTIGDLIIGEDGKLYFPDDPERRTCWEKISNSQEWVPEPISDLYDLFKEIIIEKVTLDGYCYNTYTYRDILDKVFVEYDYDIAQDSKSSDTYTLTVSGRYYPNPTIREQYLIEKGTLTFYVDFGSDEITVKGEGVMRAIRTYLALCTEWWW